MDAASDEWWCLAVMCKLDPARLKSHAATGSVLQMCRTLCNGNTGLVLEGSCMGQCAVVKLYGPDS